MRVAVVGAGAMGGSLAAHAVRAGYEVTVVDVSAALVDHITAHGLQLQTPEGPFRATPRAATTAEDVGPVELVVVFVKAEHTAAAAASLAPLVGPDTAVLTLQNGWGNADVLARQVPAERLVVGVTYNSCTATGPGRVTHSGRGPTVLGPFAGAELGPARRAETVLTGSGWPAEATTAVGREIWRKLVLNCATLPVAALTRRCAGDVAADPQLLDLVDRLAAEAVAVANAEGHALELAERQRTIHDVLERAGAGKPSMLQDVLAGRKTEIETINGAVVAAAARHGLEAGLNAAMVALVHGLERGYRS